MPYGGPEEKTPAPQSSEGRMVWMEARLERHREEINELKKVAEELRALAEVVKVLAERKKFHDKLILAAATLLVTGLLGFLMRISYWVQAAKLP